MTSKLQSGEHGKPSGLAKIEFWEPAKRPFGGGAFSIFGRVPAAQGPVSSPDSLAAFYHPTVSYYGTGPAKSEGKRFLDIGSGSSRRTLEEPLVELPPALSTLGELHVRR